MLKHIQDRSEQTPTQLQPIDGASIASAKLLHLVHDEQKQGKSRVESTPADREIQFPEIYSPQKQPVSKKPNFEPAPEYFRAHPERDSVSPENVSQHFADSYFTAALTSLASSNAGQDLIKGMIKANGNGSYTVTFPGDKLHPVRIDEKEYEWDTTGHASNYLNWASILEYAFNKYEFGKVDREQFMEITGYDKFNGRIKNPQEALQLLTGQKPDHIATTAPGVTENVLRQKLIQALDQGKAITSKTGDSFLGFWGRNQPLFERQTYAVQGFDEHLDRVYVHDPRGRNYYLGRPGTVIDGITVHDKGDLVMSLKTFKDHFDFVDIAPTK
ncbi:MAG: hypothetical protein JSS83_22695 [Cyanobacteria bacterium SZAS LIN-3]|nr:hypothetical protein [Cyanobacteria bacterium SZAS LIN-3]